MKLICGLIYSCDESLRRSKTDMARRLSPLDFESNVLDFNYTSYYSKEMGHSLKRQFISFKKLIAPHRLPDIKRYTDTLEKRLSRGGRRTVNIDPGYLDMAKFILATHKDYFHRIYLGKGVFAEITLYYRKNSFTPWEWSYPDYKSPEYITIFNKIRANYKNEIDP